VVRGRIPPPKLRNLWALRALPPKWGRTTGLVGISRSSRLQGFAPLTNPLRQVTVASDLALVSSMGFGFPFKVTRSPLHPGDARTGEPLTTEPEPGVGEPESTSTRQAVPERTGGIPSMVHPARHRRSGRASWRAMGVETRGPGPDPGAAPFQRGGGTHRRVPGRARDRSRERRARTVPSERDGVRGGDELICDATRGRHPTRRWRRFNGRPLRARHRPSWGFSTSKNAPIVDVAVPLVLCLLWYRHRRLLRPRDPDLAE
jgi:hypothetical protein